MDKIFEFIADPRTARGLVLVVVLLPLVSAAILPLFGRGARRFALWLALLHLTLTVWLVGSKLPALNLRFEQVRGAATGSTAKFEPESVPGDPEGRKGGDSGRTTWNLLTLSTSPVPANQSGPNIQFYIGVDGFNIWLAALASLMMVPAILVSWDSVKDKPGAFYGWMFLLQAGAIGAFLSFDVILFYVFFELTLIPSFFLIGRWGVGSGRRDAARKFFLYTLAGSLLTLVGIIGVVLTNPDPDTGRITFSLPDLMGNVERWLKIASNEAKAGHPEKLSSLYITQFWLFLALMSGFMVKVPVWPFHTWLPSAYGEAPIGVTILLSALLAKLGTFGILRFVLPLTPDAAIMYGLPAIGTLAAFGIIYAAFCAYDQKDIKLIFAYSSVSHLGFLVLGIFAFSAEGLSGAVLHMVNHGLTTGALFALLAFLLDRYRTTQANHYGGLMGRFPVYATFAFVLCLASIGLPGLNNFVSEMLMLAGLFNADNPGIHRLGLAVVATFGILLSSWYILTMMQKVFFNPHKEPVPVPPDAKPGDVKGREFATFGLLAGLCLLLGLFPQTVLDPMRFEVKQLTTIGERARARVRGVEYPVDLQPLGNTLEPGSKAGKTLPPAGGGMPKGGGGPKGGGPKGGGPKGGGPKGGAKGGSLTGEE
jgi:NADH-quinone oxidoreductase subunit M